MIKGNSDDYISRTFKVRRRWSLMIDRMAYWSREQKQVVEDKAFESYFQLFEESMPEHPDEQKIVYRQAQGLDSDRKYYKHFNCPIIWLTNFTR